jgi:hypothetical protein
VRPNANYLCPERRSDDGRTILEGAQTGLKSCPDLVFLVELSGLEPLTSCMPSVGSTSTRVHPRRSPSSPVPARPPPSACVAVLSCCTAPIRAESTRCGRAAGLTSGNPVRQATGACRPAHNPIRPSSPGWQTLRRPPQPLPYPARPRQPRQLWTTGSSAQHPGTSRDHTSTSASA